MSITFLLSYLWFRSVESDLGASDEKIVRMNPHRRHQLHAMRLEVWGATAGAGGMMVFASIACLCVMILGLLMWQSTDGVIRDFLSHVCNALLALQIAQWCVWVVGGPQLYERAEARGLKPSQMIREGDSGVRSYLVFIVLVSAGIVAAAYLITQGPVPFPLNPTE